MIFHVVKQIPVKYRIFHFTAIHFLPERHSAIVLLYIYIIGSGSGPGNGSGTAVVIVPASRLLDLSDRYRQRERHFWCNSPGTGSIRSFSPIIIMGSFKPTVILGLAGMVIL